MRYKPQYKDRYPGLTPFDKGQSTIFFGRDRETKELYYLVCLEKIVVLFGKSGLGKSSLLNAGVSPQLEKNNYLPVRIRFSSAAQAAGESNTENILLRDFQLALKAGQYKDNIIYNKENPRLWEYVKAASFADFAEPLSGAVPDLGTTAYTVTSAANPTPVFIFDQFEEFFHHPVAHQREFLAQLAELLHDESPYRILDWITAIEPEERTSAQVTWHQQPPVKVVFALRSDSLANMQSIVSFIPTVLRNRYELKPLTPDQAARAIEGPAGKTDLDADYVPPFSYTPATLAAIITELKGKSEEIESSQLQIVCNYIEDKVKNLAKTAAPGKAIVVDESIIQPAADFPSILQNFYESQLAKLENPEDREKARLLIEDDLVINGVRDSISRNKLNAQYGISDDLIEDILNTRLIREETTNWGPIYELSHDTLIAPVEKSKRRRQQAQEIIQQEKERKELAALADRQRKELEERQQQLEKERTLREEAEQQRAEVERLSGKLRRRGLWVFLLLLIISVGLVSIYNRYKLAQAERARNGAEDSAKNARFSRDTLLLQLQKNKSRVLYLVDTLEKINEQLRINSVVPATDIRRKDSAIQQLVDSVFVDDLGKAPNNRTITTKEKIEKLKRVYPKSLQQRAMPRTMPTSF